MDYREETIRGLELFKLAANQAQEGRNAEAEGSFNEAFEIFSQPLQMAESSLDSVRLKILICRADNLTRVNKLTEAFESFNLALRICDDDRQAGNIEFDGHRAALYMNRASVLTSLDRLQAALESYQSASICLNCRRLQQIRELDSLRVESKIGQAKLLEKLRHFRFADAILQSVAEILDGPEVQENAELDPARFKVHTRRANLLRRLWDLEAAVAEYDAAIEVISRRATDDPHEHSLMHAKLLVNRGAVQRQLGKLGAARQSLDAADHLLDLPRFRNSQELDEDRVKLQINMGNLLCDMGEQEAASLRFDTAAKLLRQSSLRDRSDLDEERGRLQICLARMNRRYGDLEKAVVASEAAVEIFSLPHMRTRPELDVDRAELQAHRGNIFRGKGDLEKALRSFNAALEFFERSTDRNDWRRAIDRAQTLMNRALTYMDIGESRAALADYLAAIEFYGRPDIVNREDFASDRAILYMNTANCLRERGDLDAAVKAFDEALELYAHPELAKRAELDIERAKVFMNRGVTFAQAESQSSALQDFLSAEAILGKKQLADRLDLDTLRAVLHTNIGVLFECIGNLDSAAENFGAALDLYSRPHLCGRTDLDLERAKVLAAKSSLIGSLGPDCRGDFVNYASQFLADKLELVPLAHVSDLYDRYMMFREYFTCFHGNWLRFAIEADRYEDIVRILATIQGRDMAARMLDELEDSELADSNVPKTVKAYQKTRLELRKLRARIEDIVSGGKVSTVSDNDGNRSFLIIQSEALAPAPESDELRALREQYNALHGELPGQREAAAQEKGYGLLSRPYQHLTLERVQQTLMPNDQAALMLLDLGEENNVNDARFHALVIREDQVHIVALPDLQRATAKMAEYPDAQRHKPNRALVAQGVDAASRDYREGPAGHQGVTFGEVTPAYVEKDYRHFWEGDDDTAPAGEIPLVDLQKRYLWQPLAQALEGVEHLISSSQGQLHGLPLQCGLPDGLSLRNYPGLVFYAGRQGLLGDNTNLTLNETAAAKKEPLGVYAYAGHSNDIPNTQKEIQWVWRLHQKKQSLQTYPLNRKDPPHVHCLHMACHGAADSNRSGQVQLVIGDQNQDKPTLDMSDILELPVRADVVYLGCCLAGQTVEDLEGEPTGLVSGFFLRGTRALVGSVVLVNDAWGAVFGVLFEYHFIATNDPHKALARAKVDIASGDWDPGQLGEEVRNHVESLRSTNDQPATPAPIPPQPILGDLLYGMRIFGE